MHKNFGEDRTSSTGDMTQTDKQTCGQQTLPSSIRLSTSQTRREPKALSEPISDTVIGSPVQVQVSRSAFCVGLTVVTDRQTDRQTTLCVAVGHILTCASSGERRSRYLRNCSSSAFLVSATVRTWARPSTTLQPQHTVDKLLQLW